jgi:hypothetical protein
LFKLRYTFKEMLMKYRYLWLAAVMLIFAFAAVSCKSTEPAVEAAPPAETLDPEAGPPSDSVLSAYRDAVKRADDARKLATDFNGPDYFPSDWQSADGLYSQAKAQDSVKTQAEARQSTTRWNAAADALEALSKTAIPRYAEDLTADVVAKRTALLATAALVPQAAWQDPMVKGTAEDYLLDADNAAAGALAKYGDGDYYGARDEGVKAGERYEAMDTALQAALVRLELEARGLVRYDPSAVNDADNTGLEAVDAYNNGDYPGAKGKADNALAAYRASLAKAVESYAADAGAAAAAERQKAVDAKAPVAVKQDFDAAEAIYGEAGSLYQAKSFDDAASLYTDAQGLFSRAARAAREKRRAAEEALRAAELKIVESDSIAGNAESILLNQGGMQ